MKKLFFTFLAGLFCACVCISCGYFDDDHNTSFNYKDTDQYYSMKAHFNKNRTRDVEKYMDNTIGKSSNMSFLNTRVDGNIALADHTVFYIKKYPGRLEIKLDKNDNSYESYEKIKTMCQGLKQVVIK